ncbi:DUF4350 domain-containing protein [Chitinophaga sp. sic0106]|uniref:DUF4350 domain-containing protein n=1 Tax=Chitinophaga sp. sic0106 TaxID=2854785 RepID=UPI001C44B76D|nr:DUF4350 domain-containing protein [Chitinophaga sp. sic0106]MBV7531480.1 hypothetical protein [Chitinophaga sp. sic0106]
MPRSKFFRGVLSVMLIAMSAPAWAQQSPAKETKVTLDYFFNHEFKKDKAGNTIRWHYTWEEQEYGGFSLWGHIFDSLGAKRDTLAAAPSAATLKGTGIYIIVDPDTEKETTSPNYMTDAYAKAIYNWVKAGGVLVLLQNDSLNAEFTNFNKLSDRFGIHFNGDSKNRVQGRNFEQGAVFFPANHEIFPNVKKAYLKEVSTLTLKAPARAVHTDADNNILMAVAKVGKGTVFAVGDPWFYNEYTAAGKLPAEFQNYNAAADLAAWLLKQVPAKK